MNLRDIKKDIRFVMNDFVGDCLLYNDFSNGKKEDKVIDLITEGLALAESLTNRVNFSKKVEANAKGVEKFVRMDAKETKAHFKAIQKDLFEGYDGLFKKLSDLIK